MKAPVLAKKSSLKTISRDSECSSMSFPFDSVTDPLKVRSYFSFFYAPTIPGTFLLGRLTRFTGNPLLFLWDAPAVADGQERPSDPLETPLLPFFGREMPF